jgi:hypothetical protein
MPVNHAQLIILVIFLLIPFNPPQRIRLALALSRRPTPLSREHQPWCIQKVTESRWTIGYELKDLAEKS